MLINVRVIPRAKKNQIAKIGSNVFKVHLTAVPEDNKANKALVKFLSGYFNVKESSVNIIKGFTSRNKIVELKG